MVMISSGPPASPDEFLDYLHGVAPDPERLGEESVRGVETTRYRTELDLRRATRRDLERDGWDDQHIERVLEGMADGPVEVEVWIAEDGLIRRIVWRNESTREPSWSSETTTEFFDFGIETAIEPPPPGEVMEQDEWLREQQAEQDWMGENEIVGEVPPDP